MNELINLILIGSLTGVWGWLFITRLIDSGQIFSFWPKAVRYALFGTDLITSRKNQPIRGAIEFAYTNCPKCFAGFTAIFVASYQIEKNWVVGQGWCESIDLIAGIGCPILIMAIFVAEILTIKISGI